MLKSPREILGATNDRLHDISAFVMHHVDLTLEYIDRTGSASLDKMYAKALEMHDRVLHPTGHPNNEEERKQ